MANNQSVTVKKLPAKVGVPAKGSAKAAGHEQYANEGTNLPVRGESIIWTGIGIGSSYNRYARIAPRSSLAVKHRMMTNAGVIISDYRGQVKVVLANLGDQPYRVEYEDRIAQRIIEMIDNRELQEVILWDDTKRAGQGFVSSNATMDQEVKGQSAKPRIEINDRLARVFTQFYHSGETMGILR